MTIGIGVVVAVPHSEIY